MLWYDMFWYDDNAMFWYDDYDMFWYGDNDMFRYDDNDNNLYAYDIVIIFRQASLNYDMKIWC